MKLQSQYLFIALLVFTGISASSKEPPLKPRVVVLTDVSTWETDDSESLVRLLVHADLFEIEGLIFTPGSELIIKLADEDDDRPVWITVWGGGNTLAQAIWRVQQSRSPEE